MTFSGNEGLLQDFIAESSEHLSSIEPDLLILEEKGSAADQEVINRVFRAIHSIKGASGFFGFEKLKSLSHSMESVLMKIRDHLISATPEVMDVMLAGVDVLRCMIDDIQHSDQVDISEIVSGCDKILGGGTGKPKSVESRQPSTGLPSFNVSANDLRKAKNFGAELYVLTVYNQSDLVAKDRSFDLFCNTLGTMGTVVSTIIPQDLTQPFHVLYATVLEKDLIAIGMDIPESNITPAGNIQPANLGSTDSQNEKTPSPEKINSQQSGEVNSTGGPQSATTVTSGSETLRVKVDLLDKLMALAGELVLARNQLLRRLSKEKNEILGLGAILQNVDLVTTRLQENIMQTRMQPIGNLFSRFPRLVRDMARKLEKKIELEISGSDVELDKSMVELLADPLTHIMRNSCDHGIETPDQRTKVGKTPQGSISLEAFHESGQVVIQIVDDGKGIDVKKVCEKAIARGAVTTDQVERMSETEKLQLVFLPGFSTAEKVTDVSGRGVGMDVVRTNIEKLGGQVEIENLKTGGTKVTLRLPLTLAIIPSLVIRVADQRFAVPQVNLVELVRIRPNEVKDRIDQIGDEAALRLRNQLLPLVRLADVLGIERSYQDSNGQEVRPDRRRNLLDRRKKMEGHEIQFDERETTDRRTNWRSDLQILVLRVGSNQYGLVVDELFDVEETVVKPLSTYINDCKCFAGATIMGDGTVAMILDPQGIATMAQLSFAEMEEENRKRAQEEALAAVKAAEKKSILLFTNSPNEIFAIPLKTITRLEPFDLRQIERVGNREFVKHNGDVLPIVRLDHILPVSPYPEQQHNGFLIFPKPTEGHGCILASNILDVMETAVNISQEGIQSVSVAGTGIIDNKMTVFLKTREIFESATHLDSERLPGRKDL